MADVITRLKLDSDEYDSKIKRATQGLLQMEQECRKVGGTLAILEKEQKQYVQSLGNMQTVATNTRGKLSELTQAYTELRIQYERLTDEEKKGDFGKALSSSLEQLKSRINDTKNQLNSVSSELGNTKQSGEGAKGGIEALTSALGINVKSLAGWGAALAAGKAALEVAKDTFFASEATVDEWGRTIQSVQSVYEGFITAINNSDISGFLSRMGQIIEAARAAYNELDKLNTMRTIQSPRVSAQQTENERLRMMIQTGRYIAPIDGRTPTMQNGQMLTPAQIRTLEKQLQGGMQKMVSLVGNEVKQSNKAIGAYYNSLALQNGMSLKEFRSGTSSWEEFDKRMQGYENYRKWNAEARTKFARQGGRGNVDFDKNNPYAQFRKWGTFRVDKMGENSYNDLVSLIQQRDQQMGQVYGTQSQAYRTINRAEGTTLGKIMGRGGGGGGGRAVGSRGKNVITYAEDSIMAQEKLVQELTQKWKTASAELKDGYLVSLKEAKEKLDEMTAVKPEEGSLKYYQEQLNETNETIQTTREELLRMKDAGADPMEIEAKQESLDNAIFKLSDIQNRIDYINGKDVDINLTSQGDTSMGDAMANDLTTSLVNAADNLDLKSFTEKLQSALAEDAGDMDLSEYFTNLKDSISEYIDENEWPSIKLAIETGDMSAVENFQKGIEATAKGTEKSWQKAVGSVGQLAGALSQIEDPAAKIIGTIGQAIATVALTFASSLKGTMTPWDWIAAAAAGTATMISTIASIHSATGYAQGGIIKGNSYSGDNIGGLVDGSQLVGLNAGEVVLNHAQTETLANSLENDQQGGVTSLPYVMGEQIILGANAFLRRSGRGELVTTKMR